MKILFLGVLLLVLNSGCTKYTTNNDPVTYGASMSLLATDKAMYKPGETVQFSLKGEMPANAKVRYRKLNETISESSISAKTWSWTPPTTDFTGYLVDIYTTENNEEKIWGSIGVDVSSEYSRFPRNGFLSKYGEMNNTEMKAVMNNLNRYHINVVQFQDWHYKHHLPLAGSGTAPAQTWKDIANRDNSYATVKGYVDLAHTYSMKTLSYNLAYGALSDAAADGVSSQWYLYKDANQTNRDFHQLGAPFKSSIYLLNPANTAWQQYIAQKTNDVYAAFNFDGFQIDQLGDRGNLFDASGNTVNLANTFKPFVQAMKAAAPEKRLVMNAVNQYGQQGIAQSPVDFLYSEVWSPNEGYTDIAKFITDNDAFGGGVKKTVLAAYMNYDMANNPGTFNTPAILLTDAVIFAFGASHLELGEHMLGKEYFPNSNLQMKPELSAALTTYYDFMVGYQNLLRDGGSLNNPAVTSTDNKINLNNWNPTKGQVSVIGREFTNRQVLHLVNFTNAAHLNWRDANGTQTVPNAITNAAISITTTKPVKKVWFASPDVNAGVATTLQYTQTGNSVSITLPSLKYWDMVVMEY